MRAIVERMPSLATLIGIAAGAVVMSAASGTSPAAAQKPAAPAAPAMFVRIAPPRAPAQELPLYASPPQEAVKRAEPEVWDRSFGNPVLRNVTVPSITPFLPAPGKATGAAVVILPGGGFTILAMDAEGWSIARWLADHGIAAFVLKYRIKQTPADETALLVDMASSMGGMMTDAEKVMTPLAPPAVADAIQALKVVRAGAAKWKIDPARVGMLGFSAGAMATRDTVLSADPASRPAFSK